MCAEKKSLTIYPETRKEQNRRCWPIVDYAQSLLEISRGGQYNDVSGSWVVYQDPLMGVAKLTNEIYERPTSFPKLWRHNPCHLFSRPIPTMMFVEPRCGVPTVFRGNLIDAAGREYM